MDNNEYKRRWRGRYRSVVRSFIRRDLKVGDTFTGEDFRLKLGPVIGDPPHHNCWGAAAREILAEEMAAQRVERRGWARMKSKTANGRLTPEYRRRHPNDLVNVASRILT